MPSHDGPLLSSRSIRSWRRFALGLAFLLLSLLAFNSCGGGGDDGDAVGSDEGGAPVPVVAGCAGDIFIQAPVEAIDVISQTLTLLDLPVRVDGRTRLNVNLADLTLFGDYFDVRGAIGADGVIVATCLEHEGARDEVELRGPVDADGIAASRLSILGVEIQTDANTVFEDGSLTQAAFFAQVQPDDLIEVEGQLQADGSLRAEEIDFDFDDNMDDFDDDDDFDDNDDDGDDFDDDDDGSSVVDLDDDDGILDDDDDGILDDDDDGSSIGSGSSVIDIDDDDDDDDDGDSDDDDDD